MTGGGIQRTRLLRRCRHEPTWGRKSKKCTPIFVTCFLEPVDRSGTYSVLSAFMYWIFESSVLKQESVPSPYGVAAQAGAFASNSIFTIDVGVNAEKSAPSGAAQRAHSSSAPAPLAQGAVYMV
jgi:hypothetical protein